jgi:hypothetical protein
MKINIYYLFMFIICYLVQYLITNYYGIRTIFLLFIPLPFNLLSMSIYFPRSLLFIQYGLSVWELHLLGCFNNWIQCVIGKNT